MCKFSLDFRKISYFVSKNIVKSNFKVPSFNVNLSICPSRLSQNPFQNNENCGSFIRTSYISIGNFKNIYLLVLAIVRGLFMRSLFIAFKNDEWCHFVARIGSPALISLLHVFRFFPISLCFLIFCELYYLLRYWGKFNNVYNKAVKLFLGF